LNSKIFFGAGKIAQSQINSFTDTNVENFKELAFETLAIGITMWLRTRSKLDEYFRPGHAPCIATAGQPEILASKITPLNWKATKDERCFSFGQKYAGVVLIIAPNGVVPRDLLFALAKLRAT
jgi:hypothetical protein